MRKGSPYPFSVLRRPTSVLRLFAVFARREVAAVDRLLWGRLLAVGPELADRRIGLDHRVPQFVLVVAEHLLLLDLLDVDVLHRIAELVERDRPAYRVDLQAGEELDELFRTRPRALRSFHDFVD